MEATGKYPIVRKRCSAGTVSSGSVIPKKIKNEGDNLLLLQSAVDGNRNRSSEEKDVMHAVVDQNGQCVNDGGGDFPNPSPRSSDSGIESDTSDGNLSWLLNYKIQELPPVPDTVCTDIFNFCSSPNDLTTISTNGIEQKDSGIGSNRRQNISNYSGPKKPPFTYTELIEHALYEKGELTVSGIYQWISGHFPFYKQNDDRWKNSVRHNLSINPHFRKGSRAEHGAGHLWTIAQKDEKKSLQIKQKMQQFIDTTKKDMKRQEQTAYEMELEAATASILENEVHNDEHYDQIQDSGVVQDIEMEFINVIHDGLEVSKQQIVQELGLGNNYLITDINPNTLGLNMTEAEVINDGTFYDDIAFEYYELEKQ